MKRNKITEPPCQDRLTEYKLRVAFHEAGHAAGIHLNNKERNLPPVFFKIILKDASGLSEAEEMAYQTTHDDCIARVEGGRLIELLPPSIDGLATELTEHDDAMVHLLKEYRVAFESDIINLLIGPLAEAKYVANTDNELFNRRLVNLKALKNYGGSSDLALVNEYLQCLSADKQEKDQKLNELFIMAFDFVNNDTNWSAISKLASYIINSRKHIICCEEIGLILDQSVDLFQDRRAKARHRFIG